MMIFFVNNQCLFIRQHRTMSAKILAFFVSSLIICSSAVVIRCDFGFDHFPIVGFQYGCFNATVTDRNDPNYVSKIYGRHQQVQIEEKAKNMTHSDVVVFQLSQMTRLEKLPEGIVSYLPNLIGLRWEDDNLTQITANDLIPFPDLLALSFWNNKLMTLDADLFKHTQKLIYINFSKNLIEEVGYGILDDMNVLEAYFQLNKCIDFIARGANAMFQLKILLHVKCPPIQMEILEAMNDLKQIN